MLEADPISGKIPIHFVNNEAIARPLYRISEFLRGGSLLSWTTVMAMAWPSYMVFERMVFRHFAGALRRREFDLIHRITPLSPTFGSPLSSLTEVPMLIGPLNGGLPWPKEYPGLRRREREWLVPLRRLHRYLPYYRSTYRHAAGIIGGSQHTASEIPSYFQGRRFYVPENGIDPSRFPIGKAHSALGPRFRFATVGRLVPYKGMDLILEAMASSSRLRECDLTIIGDGPYRAHLESMVRESGLEERVRFSGWLDHQVMARELIQSQAFVFPSLREFGGAVVLEAMALGLPAIVVAYGGPGELVTPECGFLIPMTPREQLVPALAAAMETIATDSGLCRHLGEAAQKRVLDHFTWAAKAGQIVAIYREVLGRTA